MYNTEQLASHIGVPESTVVAWRRLCVGPPPVKIAGHTMYLTADVALWIDGGASLGYGVELGPRFVA